MGKFNSKKEKETIVNHEGEKAYPRSNKAELVTAVLTTFVENSYYENSDDRLGRIVSLCEKVPVEFLAKLAVYARTKANMRSVFPVLVGELAKRDNGTGLTRKAIIHGTTRVDDVTEIVAYLGRNNLSTQVKKGIGTALGKFDEYQFAKYQGKGKDYSLVDVVNLTHPKPTKKNQEALRKLVAGTLKNTETWESKLSAGEDKIQTFTSLLNEGKLGYMALLRNLRNILEGDVNKATVTQIADTLANPENVAKSKQLPFRFYAAQKALDESRVDPFVTKSVYNALEQAVTQSVKNINMFNRGDRVLIACDVSGSMNTQLSSNSSLQMVEVGLLMGLLANQVSSNNLFSIFGTEFGFVNGISKTNFMSTIKQLQRHSLGHGTNGYKVIERLNKQNIKTDKILIFTDLQMYNSYSSGSTLRREWQKYKTNNPNCKLYVINLHGYRGSQFAQSDKDVFEITGWSDKVFDIIDKYDQDPNALINAVEEIQL